LRFLREQMGAQLFFWPFDGWQPPDGVSVIVEVYPSIFRNRYPKNGRTPDDRDAYRRPDPEGIAGPGSKRVSVNNSFSLGWAWPI
jgi:hypothetical protein